MKNETPVSSPPLSGRCRAYGWLMAEGSMPRYITLAFGVATVGAFWVGVRQLSVALDQQERGNRLAQVALIETHLRDFHVPRGNGASYSDLHNQLAQTAECFVPDTAHARRPYLEYATWLGRLNHASDDLPAPLLRDLLGHQVNVLLSNCYVQDQLLAAPERFEDFLALSRRLLSAQQGHQKARYETAQKFLNGFAAESAECRIDAYATAAARTLKGRNGPLVSDEYGIVCPSVKRRCGDFLAAAAQARITSSSQLSAIGDKP